MTDPATLERLARENQAAYLSVLRERQARERMDALARNVAYWAAERRAALWELYEALGTWKRVADTTGQSVPAIQKAAYKRPQEGTTA